MKYKFVFVIFATFLLFTGCSRQDIQPDPSPSPTQSGAVILSEITQIITPSPEITPSPSTDIDNNAFEGTWKRTNFPKTDVGVIIIKNATETSFDFEFSGMHFANMGELADTADIISDNNAVCTVEYEPEGELQTDDLSATIAFELNGDILNVSCDGNQMAVGFGNNVLIDGEYTQDEPQYTSIDLTNEVLKTDELKQKVKTLLDEEAYDNLIMLLEYGISYDNDKMTYSGFFHGLGMGINLLIKDERIYCLAYYPGETFFTNDSRYKNELPEEFKDIARFDDIRFVYKDI